MPRQSDSALPTQDISDGGNLVHLSQIFSSVASIARAQAGVSSKSPTTPTRLGRPHTSSSASTIRSPTCNTPSKLLRFLEYAESNLGIENATAHEESLWMQGFGPDILHLVDDGVLKNVGFTPGDVIRLKQNSQQWWNSTDAKRKRTSPTPPQSTPPNKRVSFEKRYHDGGTYRLYGPKIVEAEEDLLPNASFDWYYFCKARDTMVPLPVGYMPVIDGKDN